MAFGKISTMLLLSEKVTLCRRYQNKSSNSVQACQNVKNSNASLRKLQRSVAQSIPESQGLSFLLCHMYVLAGAEEN